MFWVGLRITQRLMRGEEYCGSPDKSRDQQQKQTPDRCLLIQHANMAGTFFLCKRRLFPIFRPVCLADGNQLFGLPEKL